MPRVDQHVLHEVADLVGPLLREPAFTLGRFERREPRFELGNAMVVPSALGFELREPRLQIVRGLTKSVCSQRERRQGGHAACHLLLHPLPPLTPTIALSANSGRGKRKSVDVRPVTDELPGVIDGSPANGRSDRGVARGPRPGLTSAGPCSLGPYSLGWARRVG
jgi:hypothetical protein